jgi:hypothetical protein
MARRKKTPPVVKPEPCDCAMRRTHGKARQWTDGPGKGYDCRTVGDEMFCVCGVCGSRWHVSATHEYDGGMPSTSYAWEEGAWTEDLVRARQYETLYETKREHEREEMAEYARQHDPHAGGGSQVPHAPATRPAPQESTQQTGDLEWRWIKRGAAYGCRIEGSRLSVWEENPFGGTGGDYSITEFLDGRHAKVLPPDVAGLVRDALATERNPPDRSGG